MWVLQLTGPVTLRALIVTVCEMGTVMPISKDHGRDSVAIRAIKIL